MSYTIVVAGQEYTLPAQYACWDGAGVSNKGPAVPVVWYDYKLTAEECPELVAANPIVYVQARVTDPNFADGVLPGVFRLQSWATYSNLGLGDLQAYSNLGLELEWTLDTKHHPQPA